MKTYLFSGAHVEFFDIIAKKLDSTGKWRPAVPGGILSQEAVPPKYVDLLYVTMITKPVPITARNTYSIKCHWHNIYDADQKSVIDNKMKLHQALEKTTIVMPTVTLDKFVYINGEYIARPAGKGFYSGKDILYIHDKMSWEKAMKYYVNIPDVIITRVLSNPVLIEGRKAHIRLYLFIHSGSKLVKFSPMGPIFTAKLPYSNSDWDNMDIHDTHVASTPKPYRFPEDYPYKEQLPLLAVQLRQAELTLSTMNGQFKSYSQAKDAFELFAADIMITNGGMLKILEINSKIGMSIIGSLREDVAGWVADQIIKVTDLA